MMKTNRFHITDLRRMQIGDIAALPVEQLALLQEEVDAHLRDARGLKERLDAALDRRFGHRAQAVRASHGKDTGTVRFEDGAVTVTADLPKRVNWDQRKLAMIRERIVANGDDPDQYIDTVLRVCERSFMAWPDWLRDLFAPARSVKTGKPVFRLSLNNEASK